MAKTVEGAKQIIAQGPVASQEAIKMFGTNGGGFFNANSRIRLRTRRRHEFRPDVHDFPDPGRIDLHVRQDGRRYAAGVGVFAAMRCVVSGRRVCLLLGRAGGNPILASRCETATAGQTGGNMEGKESRFGIADLAFFATITTDASCGAVNCMHDSFTPIGGLVPLFNIETG